jgi:hypothetical protein
MTETFVQILIMLLAVNGAPILAARALQHRGSTPVDLGRRLDDARPILGASKTWRGLVAALVTSCILSSAFGYGIGFGLAFGALAMAGDLISSFVKRRRGLQSSDQYLGLDQIPESLLPAIYCVVVLDIAWSWAVLWALAFMLLEIVVSRPLFLLKIRKRPY